MARQGDVIENPVVGDRVVFRETGQDTCGKLLRLELFVSPQALGPPEHVHPRQEERFEVISGIIRARVEGREQSVGAGQDMVIPPGTPHVWWNEGYGEAHVLVEVRPALGFETFLETMHGLARDGKTNDKGVPHPLQMVILSREYEMYLTKPPIPVQKALFAVLAPIARLLGYKARYPEYSDPEQSTR